MAYAISSSIERRGYTALTYRDAGDPADTYTTVYGPGAIRPGALIGTDGGRPMYQCLSCGQAEFAAGPMGAIRRAVLHLRANPTPHADDREPGEVYAMNVALEQRATRWARNRAQRKLRLRRQRLAGVSPCQYGCTTTAHIGCEIGDLPPSGI